MKRALAMALGAVLVAGSANQAAAASYVDFSGSYTAYFLNDINLGKQGSPESFTDSYFGHRLTVDVSFTPTDEIQVFWRLRGPDWARWGNDGGELALDTDFIYGVIAQDFGTFTVGKFDDGLDVYGLGSLGYLPAPNPMWTTIGPYDSASAIDAIRFNKEWDNGFGLMAQYAKVATPFAEFGGGAVGPAGFDRTAPAGEQWGEWGGRNWASDTDYDRFQLEATYKWDGGGAALGVMYDRNAIGAGINNVIADTVGGDNHTVNASIWNNGLSKSNAWYLNPAIMHSWGDFSVHFEGMFGWGERDYVNGLWGDGVATHTHRNHDITGYSFYLDGDYNYGAGNVTLSGWWVSGSDLNDARIIGDATADDPLRFAGDSQSLVSINNGNFYPLLVAYNGTASGWGRVGTYAEFTENNNGNAVEMANNGYDNYVHMGFEGNFGIGGMNYADNIAPANTIGGVSTTDTIGYNSITVRSTLAGNPLTTNDADVYDTYLKAVNGVLADNSTNFLPTWQGFQNSAADRTRRISFNEDTGANHWAVALTGNHAFTDDISMHYGLAYLGLNEPNYRIATASTYQLRGGTVGAPAAANATGRFVDTSYEEQDTDLGFEIDLGFTFQLLDNLSFNTSFGYMFNGDAYKSFNGYNFDTGSTQNASGAVTYGDAHVTSSWDDADDTYVWYNTLTFSF